MFIPALSIHTNPAGTVVLSVAATHWPKKFSTPRVASHLSNLCGIRDISLASYRLPPRRSIVISLSSAGCNPPLPPRPLPVWAIQHSPSTIVTSQMRFISATEGPSISTMRKRSAGAALPSIIRKSDPRAVNVRLTSTRYTYGT